MCVCWFKNAVFIVAFCSVHQCKMHTAYTLLEYLRHPVRSTCKFVHTYIIFFPYIDVSRRLRMFYSSFLLFSTLPICNACASTCASTLAWISSSSRSTFAVSWLSRRFPSTECCSVAQRADAVVYITIYYYIISYKYPTVCLQCSITYVAISVLACGMCALSKCSFFSSTKVYSSSTVELLFTTAATLSWQLAL